MMLMPSVINRVARFHYTRISTSVGGKACIASSSFGRLYALLPDCCSAKNFLQPADTFKLTGPMQLVDSIDLMVGKATEYISQPCLQINAAELSRVDQRIGNNRRFSFTLRSSKKPIFGPKCYTPYATFSGNIINAEASIIKIGPSINTRTAERHSTRSPTITGQFLALNAGW